MPTVLQAKDVPRVVVFQEREWRRNWQGNCSNLQRPESDEAFHLIELQKKSIVVFPLQFFSFKVL